MNTFKTIISRVVNGLIAFGGGIGGLLLALNYFSQAPEEDKLLGRYILYLKSFFYEWITLLAILIILKYWPSIKTKTKENIDGSIAFICASYRLDQAKFTRYYNNLLIVAFVLFVFYTAADLLVLMDTRQSFYLSKAWNRHALYQQVRQNVNTGKYAEALLKLNEINSQYGEDIKNTYLLSGYLTQTVAMAELAGRQKKAENDSLAGYGRKGFSALMTSYAYHPREEERSRVSSFKNTINEIADTYAVSLYQSCRNGDTNSVDLLLGRYGWFYFEEGMLRKLNQSRNRLELVSRLVLRYESAADYANFCKESWMISRADALMRWHPNLSLSK